MLTHVFVTFLVAISSGPSTKPTTQPATLEQQMILAAFRGDTAKVEALLKDGVNVNARYGEGDPHAMASTRGGWPMAARWR